MVKVALNPTKTPSKTNADARKYLRIGRRGAPGVEVGAEVVVDVGVGVDVGKASAGAGIGSGRA